MKGIEFIALGTIYGIVFAIVEFVFKLPVNKYGLFIGMIIWGSIQTMLDTHNSKQLGGK